MTIGRDESRSVILVVSAKETNSPLECKVPPALRKMTSWEYGPLRAPWAHGAAAPSGSACVGWTDYSRAEKLVLRYTSINLRAGKSAVSPNR